ncbi:hypothetical protein [Angustibacter aerolatus]
MGYEVLDAGGHAPVRAAATTPAAGGAPEVPVVAFQDLPPVPPPPARQVDPRGWWAALRTHRTSVAAVLVALLLGASVGSALANRHARSEQEARLRSTLAVTALSQSYTLSPAVGGLSVDVVVQAFNAGPRVVDVVESPRGSRPEAGRPVVETFGGTARMQPGEQIAMSVRTLLDCSDREELQLRLPLRTQDGVVRPTAVRRGQTERLVPRDLCRADRPGREPTIDLRGSLDRPQLLISNPSDLAVTVFLDSSSPQTLASSEVVSFSTRPALPLRVGAHEDRQLAVTVKGGTCTRDLDSVLQGGGGVLVLVVESAPRAGSTGLRSSMGVDLTALVGAALERDC